MSVDVTWWGHASVTVELGGVRLLTDPALMPRLAHLRRTGSPPPARSAHHADAVLVSHLHADHLHLPSLRSVLCSRVVVPSGGARLARRAARGEITAVGVGDTVLVGDVRVTALPAHHDGRRLPGSPVRGPALGYLIEHADTRVWFAGDTGLFDELAGIGPVDVALVPVGGWGPTLGEGHLDPVQAAEAVARVGARYAVPIHFGTFWPVGLRRLAPGTFRRMFLEPGARFADAVTDRGLEVDVRVLACGETATLAGPSDG